MRYKRTQAEHIAGEKGQGYDHGSEEHGYDEFQYRRMLIVWRKDSEVGCVPEEIVEKVDVQGATANVLQQTAKPALGSKALLVLVEERKHEERGAVTAEARRESIFATQLAQAHHGKNAKDEQHIVGQNFCKCRIVLMRYCTAYDPLETAGKRHPRYQSGYAACAVGKCFAADAAKFPQYSAQ